MSAERPAVPLRDLVLVPALLTLAVTLLRLAGELMRWSPTFFNREAGGGGAVVGIVWLVPVFGVYFALRLARDGFAPASPGRALGLCLLALLLMPATVALVRALGFPTLVNIAVFNGWAAVGLWIAYRAWPALGRTLIAYALSARLPVALIMLVAMIGDWGTHYELGPPGLPEMSLIPKWIAIGLVPQLVFWVGFTGIVGGLFGCAAVAIARRGRAAAA